jgi:hypothetical protein
MKRVPWNSAKVAAAVVVVAIAAAAVVVAVETVAIVVAVTVVIAEIAVAAGTKPKTFLQKSGSRNWAAFFVYSCCARGSSLPASASR